MESTKKPTLLALARIFEATQTPYAIIGGIALQVHSSDPRTTIDIDLAVLSREAIPREAMMAAGFRMTGVFEHSENWVSPDGTALQLTDDPLLADAVNAAEDVLLDDVSLRFMRVVDLLHAKLRAGSDPARRLSKRFQDLGDVIGLLESKPELEHELSPEERAILKRGLTG